MDVVKQVSTRPTRNKLRRAALFYEPKVRLLIIRFPRFGAYLFHDVTAATYRLLRDSARGTACLVENGNRHYSLVEAR